MAGYAVLLPVRLETRFDEGRLLLRVVPDDPWYDRHDPAPSTEELAGLAAFRAAAGPGAIDPDRAVTRTAWREFAERHGPARAAWLVRTFPPDARPAARADDEARFTRLPDFPGALEVWLARGGRPAERVATLPVDPARLGMDPPDPENPADRRWWESWAEAKLAGLGAEIDLGGQDDDVDAVYVVGLADTTPAALFARHRDTGALGLLAPGAPTNTVDGAPAADLADDPMAWLALLGRVARTPERLTSLLLTGDRELLGPLPGDSRPVQRWARTMLTGLWPALLGHGLAGVLGLSRPAPGRPTVEAAADWAADNVDPVGPFPTLRVGGQPYGLLPAGALAGWVSAADDPPVEAVLREPLADLRSRWAAAARAGGRGAVDGATAEHLLDLLAQPAASPGYALRTMFPLELWFLALLATGHPVTWPELLREWRRTYPVPAELGLTPARRYSSRGFTRRVRLPLVTPGGLTTGQTPGTVLRGIANAAEREPAAFATTAGAEQAVGAPTGSLLLRLAIRSAQLALGEIGRQKLGVRPGTLDPIASPTNQTPPLSRWIGEVVPADLGGDDLLARAARRVLTALRDLGGVAAADLERLLPFTLDCASHRIDPWVIGPARRRLGRLLDSPPRLGAYGWVDRPRPGTPGPTEGRLLLAPSHPQAVTAALIRDRAINDPEAGRWHMDVTSARARRAARLAEEVRGGAHPAEALGREVERAAADPPLIRALRQRFPQRGRGGPRRTCDGLRVLAANPATLGLPASVLADLAALREAVDVYADLLVAESVQHVVAGRPAEAGPALDAAAGLARPPDLTVLHTGREGRSAETACLLVIPDTAAPALPAEPATASPALVADPAAAALLAAQIGGATQWRWRAGADEVSLDDLGLRPAEALALPLDTLERLVREAAGDPAAEIVERDGSARYERAARLAGLLGRAPADEGDLPQRLDTLRQAATALAARLADASDTAAVRLATRWGVAPDRPPGARAAAARQELLDRLSAAPGDTAAAIAALASATGQIAVLGRLRRDALPELSAAASAEGEDDLETGWLPVVAAVRPPLARLEAWQFTADTPLRAWTSRPADPWQRDAGDPRPLLLAYAPVGLDLAAAPPDRTLAAGVLDRFTEIIPAAEQPAAGAFGFDAPGARAPQAILLAVPPDPQRDLDAAALVQIVAETRELARARMATPADLDTLAGVLPLTVVPSTGPTATRLER